MKIAAYWWGGKRHVGRVSDDGADVTPLALGEAGHALGALALRCFCCVALGGASENETLVSC